MKLTSAEIKQLMSYVLDREQVGWYYGNKEYFEKRHQNIKNELELLLISRGANIT
jgi:hypothetical protein